MNAIKNTTKIILFMSLIVVMILPFSGISAFADHTDNTSAWQTDMTYDITSSLNNISHASFTPDVDFEDSVAVWNGISSSWWDITRDDVNGDISVGSWFMGWHITTLAETSWISSGGTMSWADLQYNNAKDFRDVNISQGWLSYDYQTVSIHEIGHIAGIHDHTTTDSSPMIDIIAVNTVDRTLNSHDKSTIGGMY